MAELLRKTLKDILVEDAANAKTISNNEILAPGTYIAKLIGFTEEDTYQYVTFQINKKNYNFFYNYYIKDTNDLDGNLIKWLQALATCTVTDKTSMLEIVNSAIGTSYKISIYNYVSKAGKNAGKSQHAISFKDVPVIESVTIEVEDDELPF